MISRTVSSERQEIDKFSWMAVPNWGSITPRGNWRFFLLLARLLSKKFWNANHVQRYKFKKVNFTESTGSMTYSQIRRQLVLGNSSHVFQCTLSRLERRESRKLHDTLKTRKILNTTLNLRKFIHHYDTWVEWAYFTSNKLRFELILTSCNMAPISSLSITSKRAHPEDDSNNV